MVKVLKGTSEIIRNLPVTHDETSGKSSKGTLEREIKRTLTVMHGETSGIESSYLHANFRSNFVQA